MINGHTNSPLGSYARYLLLEMVKKLSGEAKCWLVSAGREFSVIMCT